MTSRQMKIFSEIIRHEGYLTIKYFSKLFNITDRMVRYDIENMNYCLKKCGLPPIKKQQKGLISYQDISILESFMESGQYNQELSVDERTVLLAIHIILGEPCTLNSFCEQYNISIGKIKTAYEKLSKALSRYDLKIQENHGAFLNIHGAEKNIRNFLLQALRGYLKEDHISIGFTQTIKNLVYPKQQPFIKNFIFQIEKLLKFTFSDEAYNTLMLYLAIMLRRIEGNHPIDFVDHSAVHFTAGYNVVKHACILLEIEYDLFISDDEVQNLAQNFTAFQLYNLSTPYNQSWALVYDFISGIEKELGISLLTDIYLFQGLINHISPCVQRLSRNISIKDPISHEVLKTYPYLVSVVTRHLIKIEEYFNVKFTIDETVLIIIHFQAAINRVGETSIQRKLQILIVCGHGYGVSLLLMQQLQAHYFISIVDTLPLHTLKKKIFQYPNIDYIISTLDIESEDINIPVLKVNVLFTQEDFDLLDNEDFPRISIKFHRLSTILSLISPEDPEKTIGNLKEYFGFTLIDDLDKKSLPLSEALHPLLILPNIKAASWEEAVRESAEPLVIHKSILPLYIDSMIANIRKYGSYFISNGIAVAHTSNTKGVLKTNFGVALADHSIMFPDGKEVHTILTFCSLDGKEHIGALISIVNILKDFRFRDFIKSRNRTPYEIFNYILTNNKEP